MKNISKRLEDCEDCEPWFNTFFVKNVKPDYMLHLNRKLPYHMFTPGHSYSVP